MAKHLHVSRATRRDAQQEIELPWLFCESDGEVSGLRASHGALVEMAQTGAARAGAGTTGISRRVQGITARQADAAHRQRGLRGRLQQLDQRHRDILWLAYGPRPWTLAPDERQRLGSWYGVALLTEAAARGWAAERRARGEKVGEADARELVETGRVEGEPLASWRQGEDPRVEVATWYAKGLGHWLRGPAVERQLLTAVRAEAERLVAEALAAWRATEPVKGKRAPEWREAKPGSAQRGGRAEDGGETVESNGDRISETRVIRYRPEADNAPLAATRTRELGS